MSGFRFCFQNQGVPLRLDCGDDTPNSGLTLTSLGTKWHLDEKNFLVTEHGYYPGETKGEILFHKMLFYLESSDISLWACSWIFNSLDSHYVVILCFQSMNKLSL